MKIQTANFFASMKLNLNEITHLGLTQSVHAKICIEMHLGSDFKYPEYLSYLNSCDKIRQSRTFLRKSNLTFCL